MTTRKESPWYSTPDTKRKRPSLKLTLAPEYTERLEHFAAQLKMSKSRVVEWMLDHFSDRNPE